MSSSTSTHLTTTTFGPAVSTSTVVISPPPVISSSSHLAVSSCVPVTVYPTVYVTVTVTAGLSSSATSAVSPVLSSTHLASTATSAASSTSRTISSSASSVTSSTASHATTATASSSPNSSNSHATTSSTSRVSSGTTSHASSTSSITSHATSAISSSVSTSYSTSSFRFTNSSSTTSHSSTASASSSTSHTTSSTSVVSSSSSLHSTSSPTSTSASLSTSHTTSSLVSANSSSTTSRSSTTSASTSTITSTVKVNSTSSAISTSSPTTHTSTSTSSPLPTPSVSGPVLPVNFPDPSIIKVNNTWYAFATGNNVANIPMAYSTDFVTWTLATNADGSERDALPVVGAWVNMTARNTWAPDVNARDDGSFVMYYSATDLASTRGLHCFSAATATNVMGPYTPLANSLVCPLSQGGAIDAAGFRDANGQGYITYKIDGNAIGHGGGCGNSIAPILPTPLILQPVAADGITLVGNATTLLDNDGLADEGVIEAPSLVRYASGGGGYALFYSRNCYSSQNYTVSYATARNLQGPYTRVADLLTGGETANGVVLSGPGGADVDAEIDSGVTHMLFHANALSTGYNGTRLLHTAVIDINAGIVTI